MYSALRRSGARFVFSLVVLALSCLTYAGCGGGVGGGSFIGSGGSNFLSTGATGSFFRAIQVDPRAEDSAGPQFVTSADLNGDGLDDLVSAWNQSQPVQIHLQRRSGTAIGFETVTLPSRTSTVTVSGLEVADFDNDGNIDIAVMSKRTTLGSGGCLGNQDVDEDEESGLISLYMGPADPATVNQALAWTEVSIGSSQLQGTSIDSTVPEAGGFSSMRIGDINLDGNPDIVAAWNTPCDPAVTTEVLLFTNPGGSGGVRAGSFAASTILNEVPTGAFIVDVAIADIDGDGDQDIVATFPDANSMNVRWFRNPLIDTPDDFHVSDGEWHTGTIAQVATQASIVRAADIDEDGNVDLVMRSASGQVVQWLRGRGEESTTLPVGGIQWQVYTIAEFTGRSPQSMAVGDLTGNGDMDLAVSAQGALILLSPTSGVFNLWSSDVIIDEGSGDSEGGGEANAFMNSVQVTDLDGDGRNDILTTLDRNTGSGITSDALVWFRSIR